MNKLSSDYLILGAGLFGFHAAVLAAQKGNKVIILEKNDKPFTQATYVNQARVHLGYHYPRSYTTARKCIGYFEKFVNDFSFAINKDFKKVYAISENFSYTSASDFYKFCKKINIPIEEIDKTSIFKENTVQAAYLTKEYSFDAIKLRDYYIEKLKNLKVEILYNQKPEKVNTNGDSYVVSTSGYEIRAQNVINATYAGINDVHELFGFEKLNLKFEACEVVLCKPNAALKEYGITVMDGLFVSLMPFGLTKYHSLTAVMYTPHNEAKIDNTTVVDHSNYIYMDRLAKKYFHEKFKYEFYKSLYTTKVVTITSEVDDARPTLIKQLSKSPNFWTVFSGKINTIYDLDTLIK